MKGARERKGAGGARRGLVLEVRMVRWSGGVGSVE
jgi:hypothetical protein